jgi:hypothetical protein
LKCLKAQSSIFIAKSDIKKKTTFEIHSNSHAKASFPFI